MRTVVIGVAVALVCLAAVATLWMTQGGPQTAGPTAAQPVAETSGGRVRSDAEHFSGYGWSIHPQTPVALGQALSAARGSERRQPQIVFVAYTRQHKPEQVVQAVRAQVGPETLIYGGSSDLGVIGPDGYHYSPDGAVGVLSLWIQGMAAGVGSADLDEAGSPEACAAQALERAKASAGLTGPDGNPSMVLMYPTYDGMEERYIDAITKATGGSVPILGGTTGGSAPGGTTDCSAIANDKVVRKGLILAVFRSEEAFAWAFGGGYDRTSKSGIVTASEGRVILEIDGRPALDVYDEWAGGRLTQALKAGEDTNLAAAFYPMCRVVSRDGNSMNLFIHIWPLADALTTRRLVSSANLWKGDQVHFGEGSWNILLNRIGLLPQRALERHKGMQLAMGYLICCEGVLKTIPEAQRNQIAQLLNRYLGDTPWLGAFTWGEQGNFEGIGNYHGNLLVSLTLFPNAAAPAVAADAPE